jgi:heat shock protein HslJ
MGIGFCNNYSTQITINSTDNTVTLGSVAATRRMCPYPQMQNERDYFAALEATTSIAIVDDKLVFSSAQGQALLTFAK